ncbi:MAG: glycosyltransferase family 2 protein [Muribaculaceae bacterium]|nr:glycosyltransferase family 2 protein [Muribaculaceae bacterium]
MNGELPSLDLAVVTHKPDGIERVAKMVLPPAEGVRYVVSWQNHQDYPVPGSLASRTDVKIYRTDSKGISNNRNNSLDHCEAEIVLFSDDDLKYEAGDLERLRRLYKDRPELELTTLISRHGDNSRFPQEEVKLGRKLPKNYSVASFEIAFRRDKVMKLRCCPELGIGSEKFHSGEDEAFLLSAIRRGIDCRFIPIKICEHPNESTGTKTSLTEGNLLGFGSIIALQYPYSATLRVPLKAWRLWRGGRAPLWKAFKFVARGAMMTRGLRKRNKKYLW